MPPKGKKAAKAEKGKKGGKGRDDDERDTTPGANVDEDTLGDNLLGLGSATSPPPTIAALATHAPDQLLRSPATAKGLTVIEDKTVTTTVKHTETHLGPSATGDTTGGWGAQSDWDLGINTARSPQSSHMSPPSRYSRGLHNTTNKAGAGSGWGTGAGRGSASPTTGRVVSAGSGNFPAFEDFEVSGPATARGRGGGGWDVASAIGSSSSISNKMQTTVSRKEETVVSENTRITSGSVAEAAQRKTSKNAMKTASKLSTVVERASEAIITDRDPNSPVAGHLSTTYSPRGVSLASATFSEKALTIPEPLHAPGPGPLTSPRPSLSPSHLREEELKRQIEQKRAHAVTTSSSSSRASGPITMPVPHPAPATPSGEPGAFPDQASAHFSRSQSGGQQRVPGGDHRGVGVSFVPPPQPAAEWSYSSGGHESQIGLRDSRLSGASSPPTIQVTSPPAMPSPSVAAKGAWRTTAGSASAMDSAWGGGTPGPGPSMPIPHPYPAPAQQSWGENMEEVEEEEEEEETRPSGSTTKSIVRKSKATSRQTGRRKGSGTVASTASVAGTDAAPGRGPSSARNEPSRRRASAENPKTNAVPTSNTLRRALSTNASTSNRPPPTHDVRIQETGGLALKPAQRAMFGRHRHATHRFFWTLPPEHDERVESLLNWVSYMGWGLGNLGLTKFLAWRTRGALFANADFRPWKAQDEPAFDWMSFEDSQNTLDRTLQESIATYDPNSTVLVFVFLVSKSGSSVGIWRRKVPIPPSLQLKYNIEIDSVKREIARTKLPVIKVEAPPREAPLPAQPVSPPPPLPKGKRRWWLFFAREKVKPPKPPQVLVSSRRARR